MFLRSLKFINLLDAVGNLSLTNVALVVCITKMALSSQLGGADVVALIGVLGNYAHKRLINDGASDV